MYKEVGEPQHEERLSIEPYLSKMKREKSSFKYQRGVYVCVYVQYIYILQYMYVYICIYTYLNVYVCVLIFRYNSNMIRQYLYLLACVKSSSSDITKS